MCTGGVADPPKGAPGVLNRAGPGTLKHPTRRPQMASNRRTTPNKASSHKKFDKRVKSTHKLNLMMPQRGGIRL